MDINPVGEVTSIINVRNSPIRDGTNTSGVGPLHHFMYMMTMAFSLILSSYIAYAIIIAPFYIHDPLPTDDRSVFLQKIRIKNINKVVIGTLNINSLPFKYEQLKVILGNYLDILIIQETKLHHSFPTEQFLIIGYKIPYRLDRNRRGGGTEGVGEQKGWGNRRGGGTEGVGEQKGWGNRRGGGTEGVGEQKGWGNRRGGGTEGVGEQKGWGNRGGGGTEGVGEQRGWGNRRGYIYQTGHT